MIFTLARAEETNSSDNLQSFKVSAAYVYDSILSLTAGYFNPRGIGDAFLYPARCPVLRGIEPVLQFHLTKLRYDARASISFADNWLAIPGIGAAAAA
jgi:hypothetical protein